MTVRAITALTLAALFHGGCSGCEDAGLPPKRDIAQPVDIAEPVDLAAPVDIACWSAQFDCDQYCLHNYGSCAGPNSTCAMDGALQCSCYISCPYFDYAIPIDSSTGDAPTSDLGVAD